MQISCSSEKSFQWYFLKYSSSLTVEIEESLSVVIFKSWSEYFWELMQFLADCVFLACEAEQVQGTPFSADVSCWWGTAKGTGHLWQSGISFCNAVWTNLLPLQQWRLAASASKSFWAKWSPVSSVIQLCSLIAGPQHSETALQHWGYSLSLGTAESACQL